MDVESESVSWKCTRWALEAHETAERVYNINSDANQGGSRQKGADLVREHDGAGFAACVSMVFCFVDGLGNNHLDFRSFIFQGIILGTVFLRSADATSAYFSRGGVLFLYVIR